jgi:hypothetical protein
MPPIDGEDEATVGDDVVIEPDEEIGAHFEEFASAIDAPAAEAAAKPDLTDPDDEDDEPELPPAPAAEQPGATSTQAAPSGPAGEPSTDIWANAPAELKADFDRLKHQLASTTGRLSSADRQLAELRTKAKDTDPGADGGDGDSASRAAAKPASIRENPQVKQLLEDYSDIAGPLVEIIEAQQQQLAELAKPVSKITADQAKANTDEQMTLLNTRHPDVATVVNHPDYVGWLDRQPRAVREAYERNAKEVVDGEEAAWVLDQFKRDAGIVTKAAEDPTPKPTPTPTPTPTPSGSAADVASKRQRQLDGNKDSGGSRGTAQPDADPDDLDAAFNQFAAKAERRRTQALGSV